MIRSILIPRCDAKVTPALNARAAGAPSSGKANAPYGELPNGSDRADVTTAQVRPSIAFRRPRNPRLTLRTLTRAAGFTLVEVAIAAAVVAVGFLGMFATVLQAGKLASAAEEEALVASGLEQRLDQLRLLEWPELTGGSTIISKVWTARPTAMAGIMVSDETITLSPIDVPGTQILTSKWNGTSSFTTITTSGTSLSGASTVKAVATLTWTGRRSKRAQTRSLVTVISRGGLSKSDRP